MFRSKIVLVMLCLAAAACGDGSANNTIVMEVNGAAPASAPVTVTRTELARPMGHAATVLPPSARVVETSERPGDVELTFSAAEPPARVADWYRRTARGGAFSLGSELTEGAEQVLTGRSLGREWTARLAPGDDGGTIGTLLLTAG